MKFQAFHVNPGEKLKEKDVNNDLSNFMSVFPNQGHATFFGQMLCYCTRYTVYVYWDFTKKILGI